MKYLKIINYPTHFYTWCEGEGDEHETEVLRNDVDSDGAILYFALVGYAHCTLDLSKALTIEAAMKSGCLYSSRKDCIVCLHQPVFLISFSDSYIWRS